MIYGGMITMHRGLPQGITNSKGYPRVRRTDPEELMQLRLFQLEEQHVLSH